MNLPSFDEIYKSVNQFVKANPAIAWAESLGKTEEGRDVKAVFVTDKTVPETDKEIIIVICGRHGQELGTRVVGPELLEWLSSKDAAKTRRGQLVIVIPVANPDGCVREEFHAPDDRLSQTEQDTIAKLAQAYKPDAVIDIHSFGNNNSETIITANTGNMGMDMFIHTTMVAKMVEDTSQKGYPFLPESVKFESSYNNFFSGMCYENFHSLSFGMEVNHYFLKPDETAESGVAIIKSLIETGNNRSPWEAYPGYPNRILLGDFFTSIRATGSNAAERRESRVYIWNNRKFFTTPEQEMPDVHTIRTIIEYSGDALPCKFSLYCRIRGFPVIKKVYLNKKAIDPYTYKDNCSTYVCVDIKLTGRREFDLVISI